MNQLELADQLGCSPAHVSRLATGTRRPSAELMVRVERVLRWPILSQIEAMRSDRYGDGLRERMDRVIPRGHDVD